MNSVKPVAWQFKDSEWIEWASITEEQYEAYRSGRHTGSGNSFEIRALYADCPGQSQPMVPDGSMSVEAAIDAVIDLFPSADRQALNVLARALMPSKHSPVRTECETCDGTGFVQMSYTVARCCGRQMENGDCCGSPEPELDVQTENCPDCGTRP